MTTRTLPVETETLTLTLDLATMRARATALYDAAGDLLAPAPPGLGLPYGAGFMFRDRLAWMVGAVGLVRDCLRNLPDSTAAARTLASRICWLVARAIRASLDPTDPVAIQTYRAAVLRVVVETGLLLAGSTITIAGRFDLVLSSAAHDTFVALDTPDGQAPFTADPTALTPLLLEAAWVDANQRQGVRL